MAAFCCFSVESLGLVICFVKWSL